MVACTPAPVRPPIPLPAPPPLQKLSRLPLGAPKAGALVPLAAGDSAWIERILASLSLTDKVAQLMMPWVSGDYVAVGSPEFERVRKWVQDDHVGGLVMSIGLPLSYAAKLNEMQALAKIPLLVASDMENGPGFRMAGIYALPSMLAQGGGTAFPPVMGLGATRSDDLAFRLGQVLGREARAVGVHLAFGPVLDVNSNPRNPIINTRSFGEDPALVSRLGAALIRGAHSMGLMTTAKHFPGHGDTETNSHISLPVISADRAHLDSVDLPPFVAAVSEGVDAIMTAHIAVTGVEGPDAGPATLSRRFMTGILRDEMHFGGLLFTDAMTMGGVAKRYGATEPLIMAIEAGADVLLMPKDISTAIATIVQAVRAGRLTESRIDASARRILAAKARAGLPAGRFVSLDSVDRIVNVPGNQAVADEIAERSITLARDRESMVPIRRAPGRRVLSVTYAEPTDLIAGRTFDEELKSSFPERETVRFDSRSPAPELALLARRAASADLVIVSVYASFRDDAATLGTTAEFAGTVDSLAASGKPVIVISFGTPYVISAFPSASASLLAWGGAPISQRAALQALLGTKPITGRLPISIPPDLHFGDGLQRAATALRR